MQFGFNIVHDTNAQELAPVIQRDLLRRCGGADDGPTQSLLLLVDNVDEHCTRARATGSTVLDEPTVHVGRPRLRRARS